LWKNAEKPRMKTPKKAANTPKKAMNTPKQGADPNQLPAMWLRFEVTYAPSSTDEQVVLVGSHSWLGNWDWKQQKKLVQDKHNTNQWHLSLTCPENPVAYHYRYRVVSKTDNKTVTESTIMHLQPMTDQWIKKSLDTVVTLPHEWKTHSRQSSIGPHKALATPSRDLKTSPSFADEAEACAHELKDEIATLQAALYEKQAGAGDSTVGESNPEASDAVKEMREANKTLRGELEAEKSARAADLENHSKQHQELQVLTDAAMEDHKNTEDRHERECAELKKLVEQLEQESGERGADAKKKMETEVAKVRQIGEEQVSALQAELEELKTTHSADLVSALEDKEALQKCMDEMRTELEDRVNELEQTLAEAKGAYDGLVQTLPDSVKWVVGQLDDASPPIAKLLDTKSAVEPNAGAADSTDDGAADSMDSMGSTGSTGSTGSSTETAVHFGVHVAVSAFTQAKEEHDTKVEELSSSLAEEVHERKSLQETVHQLKGNIRVIARVRCAQYILCV
jgi:hypothetical protein